LTLFANWSQSHLIEQKTLKPLKIQLKVNFADKNSTKNFLAIFGYFESKSQTF
jgi:hypothetical protein